MTWFLVGALSVAATLAARAPLPDRPLGAARYPSVTDAVAVALTDQPAVVAFGEYHQTEATKGIPSALRRFTEQILPVFAGRFSHLVVETWMTTGRCGDVERAVTRDVQKTTERPAATENEIETALRAAKSRGVTPRILSVTCADYEAMRPSGGSVDYDRALRVTEHALEVAALTAWADSRARATPLTVAIYGGALHNDVYPQAELRPYTFASKLMAATLGHYVEIDLMVPEYARANPGLRAERWWSTYLRTRRADGTTVMIRRGPRSFVIVFPMR